MTHDNFTEKISLWLDNELSPTEVTQLQAHITECPACDRVYRAMQQVDRLLGCAATVMVEPQPGFSARFETRLAQQQQVKRWRLWAGVGALFMGVLMVTALVVVLAGAAWVGTTPTWFYVKTLEWLGALGQLVNQARTCINLGRVFFEVVILTVQQPLFWGYVLAAIILTGLWAQVMRLVYRRSPVTLGLLI